MRLHFTSLLLAVPALSPLASGAQDLTLYGGVTVTSDYVFRSVTFSDNQPAVQPYLELEYRGFYAGVWASNVDFGPGTEDSYEVDYYLGYRGETAGGLSYDVSYARFTFDDTGDCCGEFYLNLGVPVTERLAASLDFAYDPEAETLASALGGSFAVTDAVEVSALYGRDELLDHNYWDVGVSYALNDSTSLDLRYHDTSSTDEIFVLSLSYDFEIFSR